MPGGPPRDWGLLAYLAGLDHRDRVARPVRRRGSDRDVRIAARPDARLAGAVR